MKIYRSRALILMELIVSMIVLMLIATLLVSTQYQHHRALTHLADSRAAAYLAEHTLLNLQLGRPLPAAPDGGKVEMQALADPAPVPGQTWLAVTARVNVSQEQVIGLVPTSAAGALEKPQ